MKVWFPQHSTDVSGKRKRQPNGTVLRDQSIQFKRMVILRSTVATRSHFTQLDAGVEDPVATKMCFFSPDQERTHAWRVCVQAMQITLEDVILQTRTAFWRLYGF